VPTPGATDWAYVGGLIDGEGSICLVNTGAKKRYPRVYVSSTSYELIQYMLDNFGGHFVEQSRQGRQGQKHKQAYSWRLNGKAALEFLRQVLPFLREARKRERARMLLFEYPGDDMFVQRFHDV
jgi:hypothetical protein